MKFSTLAGVALRSLFLEASWNSQGQQNLGLAAAIDPALKVIHPGGPALKAARERALGLFNTNPMLSGLAIGIILNLEEEVAAGRLSAAARGCFSAGLGRALAALGDVLLWQVWLPFCCLAAVLALFFTGRWQAPLLLPALFCPPVLAARWGGLYLGYRRGMRAAEAFLNIRPQVLAQRFRRGAALSLGVAAAALVALSPGGRGLSPGELRLALGLIAAGTILLRAAVFKIRVLAFWHPFILVAGAVVLKFFFSPA